MAIYANSYQDKSQILLKGMPMLWCRCIRYKARPVLGIVLMLGLGCSCDAPSARADDPPASPVEVPQGWQRLGPYGGKVVDVAYAPSDPNIVYALLDNRAVPVYKSTDNKKT